MYLLDDTYPRFPSPEEVSGLTSDIVAVYGNLEPDTLLAAYTRGIFPWFMPEDPIIWHSPDPRAVLVPGELHISRRLRRTIRRRQWTYEFDSHFDEVIAGCADRDATWITPKMMTAYQRLHASGHAHCIAVLDGGNVAGGLYGVGIGRMFFAESMFSRITDASKAALVHLCERFTRHDIPLIDCQVESAHLTGLGARTMPRPAFLTRIKTLCSQPTPSNLWARRD